MKLDFDFSCLFKIIPSMTKFLVFKDVKEKGDTV